MPCACCDSTEFIQLEAAPIMGHPITTSAYQQPAGDVQDEIPLCEVEVDRTPRPDDITTDFMPFDM